MMSEELDSYEPGDELTIKYERRGEIPSHWNRESTYTGEVTIVSESGHSLTLETDTEELSVHHDGELFGRTFSARERSARRVKMGQVLEIQ